VAEELCWKFTFKFLHAFLVSILSMQNVLLECQVLVSGWDGTIPGSSLLHFVFGISERLCMLGCSCWCAELKAESYSSCYSAIAD
jgi:hypothetical protein